MHDCQPSVLVDAPTFMTNSATKSGVNPSKRAVGWAVLVLLLSVAIPAAAGDLHSESVLYSFTGGNDGSSPVGLLAGPGGVLYGVTSYGGDPLDCPQGEGCGTVYQLSPPSAPGGPWTKTVIFQFNGNNGSMPYGGLTSDANGNLYGTTMAGGTGVGTIYELSPPTVPGGAWIQKVLHNFAGSPSDGNGPTGRLLRDSHGDLFGTTVAGGIGGNGTVFELMPPSDQNGGVWSESVIFDFGTYSGYAGAGPNGDLVQTVSGVNDAEEPGGALYGTTFAGGSLNNGGVVFQLSPPKNGSKWTISVLYVFEYFPNNSLAGAVPAAGVYMDRNGNLFGTTTQGGVLFSNGGSGSYGTVYELSPPSQGRRKWGMRVIYAFTNQNGDGYYPSSYLIADPSGALYGTTSYGGGNSCLGGCGIAFKLENMGGRWVETVLHDFRGPNEVYPNGLLLGTGGVLYGTTSGNGIGCNGNGCGTVFELQ
jgi:uncharacterized repeat protein (TIGR03803 family)